MFHLCCSVSPALLRPCGSRPIGGSDLPRAPSSQFCQQGFSFCSVSCSGVRVVTHKIGSPTDLLQPPATAAGRLTRRRGQVVDVVRSAARLLREAPVPSCHRYKPAPAMIEMAAFERGATRVVAGHARPLISSSKALSTRSSPIRSDERSEQHDRAACRTFSL